MLLPPAAMYVGGAATAVTLIGTAFYTRSAGSKASIAWAGGVLTAVLAAVSLILVFGGTEVIRIGGTEMTVERSILLGSSTLHLRDHDVDVAGNRGSTYVVNDSPVPVHIEERIYAQISFTLDHGADDVVIAPGTAQLHAGSIDYVGPDHAPPDEVEADEHSTRVTKYWLTW